MGTGKFQYKRFVAAAGWSLLKKFCHHKYETLNVTGFMEVRKRLSFKTT